MLHPCACCDAWFFAYAEENDTAAYCDRCEVAYLEFKLGLLVAAFRRAARKADEV